jgi:hypothetical protein
MFFSPCRNTSFRCLHAGTTLCHGSNIIGLQSLSKALTVFTAFFLKADAIFNRFPHLLFIVNTGQLFGKPGVPAGQAPRLNPVSFWPFCQAAGWTNRNAFSGVHF